MDLFSFNTNNHHHPLPGQAFHSKSSGSYINDPNAFLFSLRRAWVSFKDIFTKKSSERALIGNSDYGPLFGGGGCDGCDIYIHDLIQILEAAWILVNHIICQRDTHIMVI